MLAQSLRASRSSLARVARQQATGLTTKRTFVASAIRQADLIQDLYLKELKAYKAPAVKASDAEGHVLKWSPPKAPKSPEETDIANELKAYEASTVEVEGQSADGTPEKELDWFEDGLLEEEEHAAH